MEIRDRFPMRKLPRLFVLGIGFLTVISSASLILAQPVSGQGAAGRVGGPVVIPPVTGGGQTGISIGSLTTNTGIGLGTSLQGVSTSGAGSASGETNASNRTTYTVPEWIDLKMKERLSGLTYRKRR